MNSKKYTLPEHVEEVVQYTKEDEKEIKEKLIKLNAVIPKGFIYGDYIIFHPNDTVNFTYAQFFSLGRCVQIKIVEP